MNHIYTFPGVKGTIQKRWHITPKLKSRWEGLLTWFFLLFSCFFETKTLQTYPRWLPKEFKMAPTMLPRRLPDLQEAPRTPPRRSKMPSRRPKRAQDAPRGLKELPRPPKWPENDPQALQSWSKWRPDRPSLASSWNPVLTPPQLFKRLARRHLGVSLINI